MNIEQLNKGVELRRQISRLRDLLEEVKNSDHKGFYENRSGFVIRSAFNEGFSYHIENGELEFFIDSIESRINILEREFNRL